MKQIDILNQIEEILKNNLQFSGSKNEEEVDSSVNNDISEKQKTKRTPFKDIFNLIISFFMSVVKAPFQLIHVYIKNEIVAVIKKEVKLYFVLICLMGVLLTIFIVFWVLISLAVGIYFQEQGISNFNSILLAIAFQLVSFSLVTFIFFRTSRKIKSLRMLKKTLKD